MMNRLQCFTVQNYCAKRVSNRKKDTGNGVLG